MSVFVRLLGLKGGTGVTNCRMSIASGERQPYRYKAPHRAFIGRRKDSDFSS
jgi:hypothetical protein